MITWLVIGKISLGALGTLATFDTIVKTGVWKRLTIKQVKGIDFKDGQNRAVMGITRHGKTFAVMHSAKGYSGAVLFFNTQHEKTPSGFITFDPSKHDKEQLLDVLKRGKKINFLPSVKQVEREKQLEIVTNILYDELRNMKVLCLWDEVHLFKKEGKNALIQLATTGLRWNKFNVFMSQRPAMIDNTLLTQSTEYIFFKLSNNDYSYLESHGYPVGELKDICKEKYIFAVYDQMTVKGGYKIKP